LISKSHNASSTAETTNLELSDDLKKLGFSKVVVPVNGITKNMTIVHNNRPIIATLDIHNWSNTDKSVRTALSKVRIDNQTIEKFMVFLSQEYVKVMEEPLTASAAKEEGEDNGQKSAVDQILIELKYTELLQRQVNYYNSHFFKNFQLSLKMEDT
jgi:hypothetical protein